MAVAGVPNVTQAGLVARTPLWIVHGNRDETNPIRHDRTVFRPVIDAGGSLRFWEMDLLDHAVPPWLLANDDFARWLFTKQRRSE